MSHPRNFFLITQRFEDQVGDALSFIWASYCGMWKIHRDANALNDALGVSNWKDAEKYLLGDVPDAGGIDLKEIAIRRSWVQHQLTFEQMMLVQMAALYEDWTVQFSSLVSPGLPKIAEVLQFPEVMPRNKLPSNHPKTWVGWWNAIDASPSALIQSDYRPALMAQYAPTTSSLNALLCWFRFFKECRNASVHNGGEHSKSSVQAYASASVTDLMDIGLSRNVDLRQAPIEGEKIELGIKNAQLGLAVIGRLANGFDALLCHSMDAESYMVARIKEAVMAKGSSAIPSAKSNGREKLIRSALAAARLPLPKDFANTDVLFKKNNLIAF